MQDNLVILGDNYTKTIEHLEKGSVDLLFTDPLWKTNKKWLAVDNEGVVGRYEDDFATLNCYLDYLYKRVVLWKEYLKPNGILALHVDSDFSAYIQVYILDKIFSPSQRVNTIIWSYRRWAISSKRFNNLHQDILIYKNCKDNSHVYNEIRIPLKKKRRVNLVGPDRKAMRDKDGNVVYKEQVDRPLGDVWDDIPPVPNTGGEKVGYPTQKPLAIAERIINVFTNADALVFDPHAGSGTTAVAAGLLKRRFITIDYEQTAYNKTIQRLVDNRITFKSINGTAINIKSIDDMSDYEYQCHIVEKLNGVSRGKGPDGGIDGEIVGSNTAIAVTRSRNTSRKVKDFYSAMVLAGFFSGIMVSPKAETKASKDIRAELRLKNKANIVFKTEEEVLGENLPEVVFLIEGFKIKALPKNFKDPVANFSWFVNENEDRNFLFGLNPKFTCVIKQDKSGILDLTGKVTEKDVQTIRCVVSDIKGRTAVHEEDLILTV